MQLSYRFRQWLTGLVIFSLTFLPSPASIGVGGDVVYDPANYAQNVLAATRSLQSNINEAVEIANQLHQIELEARNLVSLPQAAWDSVQADLKNLREITQSTSGISYSLQRLSTQFKEMYPGYQAPTDYEQEYKNSTDTTLKAIDDAVHLTQKQSEKLQAETDSTQSMMENSANAQGQMQVLQTGNMLSIQLVNQLQLLRQQQMIETRAQNTYMAAQVQDEASRKAALKNWLDRNKSFVPHM